MIPRPVRFLAFALLAAFGTFVVIAVVMRLVNPPKAIEDAVYDHLVSEVNVIDLNADPALKKAMEDSLKGKAPTAEVENPVPKPQTAYSVPPRQVKGFVQIEVKLDAAGKVIDAKVVGSIPPGVYDKQALAQVRGRQYRPITVDGRAVPGKVTEVIDFTVPAPSR